MSLVYGHTTLDVLDVIRSLFRVVQTYCQIMGKIYAYMTETRTLKVQGYVITEKYMNQNSILRGSNAMPMTAGTVLPKGKSCH